MAAKGKRTVESVEFRRADHPKGSFVSETRHKIARGGQGGGPEFDYKHETGVHESIEHAQKHLAKMFSVESGTDKDGDGYDKEDRGGPEKATEAE